MGLMRSGIAATALAAVVSVGCQNKVYDENQKMREQNRELQAQLDEAHRQAQPRQAEPAPAAPRVTETTVLPTIPPPATLPTATPKTDLGGLETSVDPAAGTTTVRLPGDVFFAPGKATIQETAKSSLDKVARALKRDYAGKAIRVEGHTDSDPIRASKWKSNQELSEARAAAVRDYLVKQGISAGRITTSGFGASKPLGMDKAKNRRVEVVVVTG